MDLEHQRSYIYQPTESEERTPKRQCTEQSRFQPQLKERLRIYRDLWAEQEQRIQVLAGCIILFPWLTTAGHS